MAATVGPEVTLAKLTYNTKPGKAALEAAKQDVARFRVAASEKYAEYTRARIYYETQYSVQVRRENDKRLSEIRRALNSASGAVRDALRQELADRTATAAQIQRQGALVQKLRGEYQQLSAEVRRAQASAGAVAQAGGFSTERLLAGFSGKGALQTLGLGAGGAVIGTLALSAAQAAGRAALEASLDAGRLADELEELSQQTGISSKDLLRFGAIGKIAGVSLEDMVTSTRKLSAAIIGGGGEGDGLSDASNKAGKVLAALGIATRDGSGNARNFRDVLLDLSDAFKGLPDGPVKAQAAIEVLGRSGQKLIPFLNLGREGVAELLTVLDDLAPNLTKSGDLFNRLEIEGAKFDLTLTAIKANLSEGVLPSVIAVTRHVNELLATFQKAGTVPALKVAFGFETGVPNINALAQQAGIKLNPVSFANKDAARIFQELATASERARNSGGNLTIEGIGLSPAAREVVEVSKSLQGSTEMVRLFNGALAKGLIIIEEQAAGAAQLTDAQDAQVKKLQDVLRGEKDAEEAKRAQLKLAESQERVTAVLAEREKILAETAAKTAASDGEKLDAIAQRADAVEAELRGARLLEEITRANADNAALGAKARAEEQEKYEAAAKRTNQLLREAGELTKEQADTIDRIIRSSPLRAPSSFLSEAPTPVTSRDFAAELANVRVQEAQGVNVLREELAIRQALTGELLAQIQARVASGAATDAERQKLESLISDLRQNREAVAKIKGELFNRSGLGQFVNTFRQFSDIIGKFSAGLNKTLSQIFAVAEGFGVIANQLRLLGGGTQDANGRVTGGSVFSGIGNLFRRGSGLSGGQRISGLLGLAGAGIGGGQLIAQLLRGGFSGPGRGAGSGALLGGLGAFGLAFGSSLAAGAGFSSSALGALGFLGGPLGLAIIGGAAGLGALFGAQKKKTRNIAKQIREEIKESLTAFNEGRSSLKDTIASLERERADAIRRLSGKKGGKKELEPILAELDKQLSDLRARQKQILEDFSSKAAIFKVPEGARDAAEAIAAIAKELKAAADAGASAADQITFLNGALEELKNKIGRDLRDEELETIDLLREQIDLQKQRADIIKQADEAELAVKRRAGLERALTPGQQAALEIKAIREQKAEKLKELEEREALLKAELQGRAELFGIELEGLSVQEQRTSLLNRQVELTRQMTAELVAQIRAQQDFYRDLAAGRIPALPAGVLPVGFNAPAGSTYTFQPGAIVVQVGSGRLSLNDRDELRRAMEQVFRDIAERRRRGLAS